MVRNQRTRKLQELRDNLEMKSIDKQAAMCKELDEC